MCVCNQYNICDYIGKRPYIYHDCIILFFTIKFILCHLILLYMCCMPPCVVSSSMCHFPIYRYNFAKPIAKPITTTQHEQRRGKTPSHIFYSCLNCYYKFRIIGTISEEGKKAKEKKKTLMRIQWKIVLSFFGV